MRTAWTARSTWIWHGTCIRWTPTNPKFCLKKMSDFLMEFLIPLFPIKVQWFPQFFGCIWNTFESNKTWFWAFTSHKCGCDASFYRLGIRIEQLHIFTLIKILNNHWLDHKKTVATTCNCLHDLVPIYNWIEMRNLSHFKC